MRVISTVAALFGLLAVATLQVEISSAATLRGPVIYGTEEDNVVVLADNEDNELSSFRSELADALKERVEKITKKLQEEIEKVKELGVAGITKEVAERIKRRVTRIEKQAKKIAQVVGETKLGAAAKKLVQDCQEVLQKIRKAITGKGEEQEKPVDTIVVNLDDEDTDSYEFFRSDAPSTDLFFERCHARIAEIVSKFLKSNKGLASTEEANRSLTVLTGKVQEMVRNHFGDKQVAQQADIAFKAMVRASATIRANTKKSY